MIKCSYHCSCCGAHFNSLEAFDAHRVGGFSRGRKCGNIHKIKKLEIVVGTCDISRVPVPADGSVGVCRLK